MEKSTNSLYRQIGMDHIHNQTKRCSCPFGLQLDMDEGHDRTKGQMDKRTSEHSLRAQVHHVIQEPLFLMINILAGQ